MPGSKKDSNKPGGRVSSYAFFIKNCRQEATRDRPGEKLTFTEFSAGCAQRWKAMSEKEKAPFQELASRDKVRYDREMKNYVPPPTSPGGGGMGKGGKKGGKGSGGKKSRAAKDPNAPKRPLSAYFWFTNDERPKVKIQHPEYKVGDVAKAVGLLWGKVDPALKKRYEEKAQQDKARYERELATYKNRQQGKVVQAAAVVIPPQRVEEYVEEDSSEEDEPQPQRMAGVQQVEEDDDEEDSEEQDDDDDSDEEEEAEEDSEDE